MEQDAKTLKLQNSKAASQCSSIDQIDTYQRQKDLPRLLALWPHEIKDETATGTRKIIARLRCALRAERQRGRAGHWSYDLDRHLGLVKAYKSEVAALENRTIA
jgi:hypothetical protein